MDTDLPPPPDGVRPDGQRAGPPLTAGANRPVTGTPTLPAVETALPGSRVFRRLLVNTLMSGVTSSFLWFALTFWVFLETRSVVATGVIGGAFSLSAALLGPYFGTYVDRHRKHTAMLLTTVLSTACFIAATLLFLAVDADDLLRLRAPWFWLLIGTTLLGSVAGRCAASRCPRR